MLSEKDLQDLNTAATLIISIIERHNVRDEDATERRALFRLVKNENVCQGSADAEREFVEFTEKEILQMPKEIRNLIIVNRRRCRLRKRRSGASETYEIRFRSDGYNVSACGKTKELARANMLKKLKKAKPSGRDAGEQGDVPTTFSAFALYFFEYFRKEKVAPITYHADKHRLEKHLLPYFKETELKKITPTTCKALLDRIRSEGKGKTADELHSIMNIIFKGAIAHGILQENPMNVVFHVPYVSTSGKALTREEEQKLLSSVAPNIAQALALALYTGLRPNEWETARIEGAFVVAVNSKRHNRKVEWKKIPICDKLRPYVADGLPVLPLPKWVRVKFNEILPNHRLYDLRTTFYTRCDELGVAPPARDHFVGHSGGVLTNTYRDLSDAYLLKEGKKLNKW